MPWWRVRVIDSLWPAACPFQVQLSPQQFSGWSNRPVHSYPEQSWLQPPPSFLSAVASVPGDNDKHRNHEGLGHGKNKLWRAWAASGSQLTLSAAAKLFFRLVAMLISSGSRQVIMAMPAVRFLIMWWAATRMRDSSESRAKSFLMICSHVVMAILMERSTTGCTSSWTARSTDWRTHCLSWGWACSRAICRQEGEQDQCQINWEESAGPVDYIYKVSI